MREPKGIEISPYEERIRRNLLVVSFFALAFICLDLQINPDSKFLGAMTFSNLTPNKVYILLLLIIGYESVHYLWNLKTSFMHWRVRLTGISHIETRGNRAPSLGSKVISPYDFSGKDENSNLYVWMFESQHHRKGTMKTISQTSNNLEKSLIEINNWKKTTNNSHIHKSIMELTHEINTLKETERKLIEVLDNVRTDSSLLRFDQWFRFLINSQNIRWLCLDVILPLSLALIAISVLVCKIDFSALFYS